MPHQLRDLELHDRQLLQALAPGRLYDKFIGESERRLEPALEVAARLAPVVRWIDEIEKGFTAASQSESDAGLSRRIFGRLLAWLQDRPAPVFVVGTCNDVTSLPPELMRKGRFDEVFFVDLLRGLHLRLRSHDRPPSPRDRGDPSALGAPRRRGRLPAILGLFSDGIGRLGLDDSQPDP